MTDPASPIVIRRAGPADAEAITLLHLDCWDDAYTGVIAQELLDDRRTNVAERVDTWRRALETGEPVFVAESAAGLAGMAGAGLGRDNDIDTDLELKILYVRASHWGTGLGYALFEEAVGDRAAYLWVLAANKRAQHFYERQGFRLDGTEDEHDEGLHVRMVRAGT